MFSRRTTKYRANNNRITSGQPTDTVGRLTTELRSYGVPFDDERMYDADGVLLPPVAGTRVGRMVRQLGRAAGAGVAALAGPKIEDMDLVEEAGQTASAGALAGDMPERRGALRKAIDRREEQLAALENVPDRALPKKRAGWNTPGKLLMIGADTAVLATPLYLTGTPVVLSVIYSLGIAVASVVAGAYVGGQVGQALDRHRRGPAPENAPSSVVHLYAPDGPRLDAGLVGLLVFVGMISLALATAVTLKLIGGGDVWVYALGAAIPAAVTPWGSAALEAWSSNAAHNSYVAVSQELVEDEARYDRLYQLDATAADRGARLAESRSIVELNVEATRAFTEAEADIRPMQPRIYGYNRPDESDSTASSPGPFPTLPYPGSGLRRWIDPELVNWAIRQPQTPAPASSPAQSNNGYASDPARP